MIHVAILKMRVNAFNQNKSTDWIANKCDSPATLPDVPKSVI